MCIPITESVPQSRSQWGQLSAWKTVGKNSVELSGSLVNEVGWRKALRGKGEGAPGLVALE